MVVFEPPQWRNRTEMWILDATRSSAAFILDDIVAGFPRLAGTLTGAFGAWNHAELSLAMEAASVRTGSTSDDEFVRSKHVLDAERHARITFRGRGQPRHGDRFAITGVLTLRGHNLPLTFQAAVRGATERHPAGLAAEGTRRSISAHGVLSRPCRTASLRERVWDLIALRHIQVLLHAEWMRAPNLPPAA